MKDQKLTPRQERFVDEYLKDLNASAAAERAGYKAPEVGRRLITKSHVAAKIKERQAALAKRVEISQDYVLENLKGIVEAGMAQKSRAPFLKAAAQALDLLGKHLGMYTEKREITGAGGAPISTEITVKFVD